MSHAQQHVLSSMKHYYLLFLIIIMLLFFNRSRLKILFAGINSATVSMPMSHCGSCCYLTEEFIEACVKKVVIDIKKWKAEVSRGKKQT